MQSREEKQAYINELLSKTNVPSDNFMQFLQVIRPNGNDLDVWTLEELSENLEKFLSFQNKTPASSNALGSANTSAATRSSPSAVLADPPIQRNDFSVPLYKEEIPLSVATPAAKPADETLECIITE
eukprot:TRINITY_DN4395_c0_g1_i5.p1 TRINITY_DN4395_c0_g1~~TRINITY_DN4395_c0_g1_i5.p1  ORF type:complete len:127 (+),score=19.60 TRINITY_DN4395_c0_g1_i5:82-462(+)